MAQSGNFTPILLYASSTPGNIPLAGNLTNSTDGSETGINIADGRLFYKDPSNNVQKIADKTWVGTVTSVAALTLGTTGTDLSSTVANGTSTPVITLNVPTASATNRGALSSTDWSTFNGKQAALVSGTNIKTVGGVSLLGSGDVGTIGVAYGGTGKTTFNSGSLLYGNGTGAVNVSTTIVTDGTYFAIGPTSPVGANRYLEVGTSSIAQNYQRYQCKTAGFVMSEYVASGFDTMFVGLNNSGSAFNGIPSGAGGMLTAGAIPIVFATSATERLRIFGSGGVSIGNTTDPGAGNLRFNTTNSNGIYFGSSSLLADYEEGLWTPNQGAGLTVVGSFSSVGTYTKVGRLVTVNFSVNGSTSVSVATGGQVICSNLPFTTQTAYNGFVGSGLNANNTVGFQVGPYSTSVYSVQAVAATSGMYMTATYYTA